MIETHSVSETLCLKKPKTMASVLYSSNCGILYEVQYFLKNNLILTQVVRLISKYGYIGVCPVVIIWPALLFIFLYMYTHTSSSILYDLDLLANLALCIWMLTSVKNARFTAEQGLVYGLYFTSYRTERN